MLFAPPPGWWRGKLQVTGPFQTNPKPRSVVCVHRSEAVLQAVLCGTETGIIDCWGRYHCFSPRRGSEGTGACQRVIASVLGRAA